MMSKKKCVDQMNRLLAKCGSSNLKFVLSDCLPDCNIEFIIGSSISFNPHTIAAWNSYESFLTGKHPVTNRDISVWHVCQVIAESKYLDEYFEQVDFEFMRLAGSSRSFEELELKLALLNGN